MTDLAAQILAALDRAEETARAATPGAWEAEAIGSEGFYIRADNPTGQRRRIVAARCTYEEWGPDKGNAAHIAANDPDHVLRLTTALRKVVELHTAGYATCADETWGHNATCATCRGEYPCPTLAALASVWDEPGDNT